MIALNSEPPELEPRVRHREWDEHTIKVQMKLTRLNLNAVGTHFGARLYAMCDPWFMLILMQHLGHAFLVWDKGRPFNSSSRGAAR